MTVHAQPQSNKVSGAGDTCLLEFVLTSHRHTGCAQAPVAHAQPNPHETVLERKEWSPRQHTCADTAGACRPYYGLVAVLTWPRARQERE